MANGDQVVIEPRGGWSSVNWRELWRYRELLFFLTWRDVKVRYKQTVLGVAWALLQPLTRMLVLTFVFRGIARMPSEGYPYPVFLYAALLPWQFFANCLRRSSDSVVGNAALVGKVYFPRLIMPLSSVGSSLVDLVCQYAVLAGLMAYFGFVPGMRALMVVPLTLAAAFVALGVGTLLSALEVAYRDVRYVVGFLLEVWFFVTPVFWSLEVVPERLGFLVRWNVLALNPMCGIVEAFRSALLPGRAFPWQALGVSGAVGVGLFALGLLVFRRIEKEFADVI